MIKDRNDLPSIADTIQRELPTNDLPHVKDSSGTTGGLRERKFAVQWMASNRAKARDRSLNQHAYCIAAISALISVNAEANAPAVCSSFHFGLFCCFAQ
jgi:hypothetical protein